MNLTDEEKRVIDILVGFGPTADPHTLPLHAVSKAMKWESTHTSKVVNDLVERGLIRTTVGTFEPIPPGEPLLKAAAWWERIEED